MNDNYGTIDPKDLSLGDQTLSISYKLQSLDDGINLHYSQVFTNYEIEPEA